MGECRKPANNLVVAFGEILSASKGVFKVKHGQDMTGLNPIAVLNGKLCDKDCEWCNGLKGRIASRRVF